MTEDRRVSDEAIWELTTVNRLRLAELLESLDDTQWRTETLCTGWTVHHMAAHLVQPMVVGFPHFLLAALRHRGNTARTVDAITRRLARRPREELTAALRRHSDDRLDPPRVGPMGPFSDSCIHLRDIARPLRLEADVPARHWEVLMDHLAGPAVIPGLVPPGRIAGLELIAVDAGWQAGVGAPVRGMLEALALGVTGRAVALDELEGPGVALLRTRLLEEATPGPEGPLGKSAA
ncbi:maleylpyruvate isomerase family mycothiol-dependent enzyme [Nesterenkonia sp. HG001]|uniref:maleylpyruvate isomerase family mycothiol-dependent enzyme n=1 Tax=Nesterenkonia sp. HG001 TaxID=2983207 RepID=UPI002AC75F50|nr:maleylpyruvate isomerase family mycothiol-dependent enzyme [Nesterenkonia sp. HG001]MDZ5078725.1 maleylpyruvate isomerase family mycothiol-dependent enzyme [Nesterenkonia sp. HG001]